MVSEPFWCEELGKYLQIIPNEEADKICRDVQLYCKHKVYGKIWKVDKSPEEYHLYEYPYPSHYYRYIHAIEVHVGKPEYDPPTSST